jgi:hypothetical protein
LNVRPAPVVLLDGTLFTRDKLQKWHGARERGVRFSLMS